MKKLLILNGPNLNMLGLREPEIYGKATYADLVKLIEAHAEKLGIAVDVRQTNHEGVLVDWIQEARGKFDGIVLDAAKAAEVPMVEVHISDVSKREDFRQISYIRAACKTTISGHGFEGYLEAIDALVK